MAVEVESTLTGYRLLAYGGVALSFKTQELSPEAKTYLSEMHSKFGYLLFSPNKHQLSDIPKEQAKNENISHSQKLRVALYEYYKKNHIPEEWDVWYKKTMDNLINRVTGKNAQIQNAEQTTSISDLQSIQEEDDQGNSVQFAEYQYQNTCPECEGEVVNGVCQSAGCKERLL